MANTVIVGVDGGFYFFGTEMPGPDGYMQLDNSAMFGGFAGGKGVGGVARGLKGSTVTLDPLPDGVHIPLGRVVCIIPSIDLWKFAGTTRRE